MNNRELTSRVPAELPPHPDADVRDSVESRRDSGRADFLDNLTIARAMLRQYPELMSGPVPEALLASYRRANKGEEWEDSALVLSDDCLRSDFEYVILNRAMRLAEEDAPEEAARRNRN